VVRRFLIPLVVAAALIGAAFASPASAAKACRYLKSAEIRRVVGVATVTKAVSPGAPSGVTRCDFDVGTADDASVHVWVQRDEDADDGFAAAKEVFAGEVEPVPGLGKRAFYVGDGFNVFYVLRAGTLAYVQYTTPSDDDAVTRATVEDLAKIVLARI